MVQKTITYVTYTVRFYDYKNKKFHVGKLYTWSENLIKLYTKLRIYSKINIYNKITYICYYLSVLLEPYIIWAHFK
jgi:hypothetical protein